MPWYLIAAAALILVIGAYLVRSKAKAKPKTTCRNWSAVFARIPGGSKTGRLRVTGECSFPTAGYVVALTRHTPQGINPAYLLLDKVVHPPAGPAAQVITVVPVEYSETTDFVYEFVTILPDDATIPVKAAR